MDQREVQAKELLARTEEWEAAGAASRRAWALAGAAAEAAYSVRAAWLREWDEGTGMTRAKEWAKLVEDMEAWAAEAAAEAAARGRALEEAVAAAEAASARCRTAL